MESLNRHEDYGQESLDETHLSDDPIKQFSEWLVEAEEASTYEPNGFVLSTINKDNTPSSRTMLLKCKDDEGFVFFIAFPSRKGLALDSNPHVSAVFSRYVTCRQGLNEGIVPKISDKILETYYHSRPHESQVAAWSSK